MEGCDVVGGDAQWLIAGADVAAGGAELDGSAVVGEARAVAGLAERGSSEGENA